MPELFRLALAGASSKVAPLPRKPGAGAWKPLSSRSVDLIGRVACAHVQPATVKAYAPVMSRFPTPGFGRRPEWT
jgi:hypothetical protein